MNIPLRLARLQGDHSKYKKGDYDAKTLYKHDDSSDDDLDDPGGGMRRRLV